MDLSADDLAGVVDLFGGLTRAELGEALAELAFKRGEDHDPTAFEESIDAAVRSYHLVAVDPDDAAVDVAGDVLVAGPVAFPELPAGATDLPHILDIDDRTVDRGVAARAAEGRLRADASRAVDDGDAERIDQLLDASYELEAWGDVALTETRARLDETRE
jgi:hypothetical protein